MVLLHHSKRPPRPPKKYSLDFMTLIFSFGIYSQIYAFPVFVRRSMIVYINIGNLITIPIAVDDMSMYRLEHFIHINIYEPRRCVCICVMVLGSRWYRVMMWNDVDTNVNPECKNRYLIDLNYMPYGLWVLFLVCRTWYMTITTATAIDHCTGAIWLPYSYLHYFRIET